MQPSTLEKDSIIACNVNRHCVLTYLHRACTPEEQLLLLALISNVAIIFLLPRTVEAASGSSILHNP